MNPTHLLAQIYNEWARTTYLWSKWCDQVALELWGM